jgi:hypothetical protein
LLPAPRTEEKPNGIELKKQVSFSEDGCRAGRRRRKYQAAKPLFQRVEDKTFHRFARKIGLQLCHQMLAE